MLTKLRICSPNSYIKQKPSLLIVTIKLIICLHYKRTKLIIPSSINSHQTIKWCSSLRFSSSRLLLHHSSSTQRCQVRFSYILLILYNWSSGTKIVDIHIGLTTAPSSEPTAFPSSGPTALKPTREPSHIPTKLSKSTREPSHLRQTVKPTREPSRLPTQKPNSKSKPKPAPQVL